MERFSNLRFLPLTERQKSIIIGTLLGDGYLNKRGNSCRLGLRHSTIQSEYMKWKMTNLMPFFNPEPILEKTVMRGKIHYSHKATSMAQRELRLMYPMFYDQDGKKIVGKGVLESLTPLSIAVWYMDDGTYDIDGDRVRIYTNCFDFNMNEMICKMFYSKFGIRFTPHRKFEKSTNKHYWFIMCKKSETEKFINLISDFIIPSMQYKLHRKPVTTTRQTPIQVMI